MYRVGQKNETQTRGHNSVIYHYTLHMSVKKKLKSANIWQSCKQDKTRLWVYKGSTESCMLASTYHRPTRVCYVARRWLSRVLCAPGHHTAKIWRFGPSCRCAFLADTEEEDLNNCFYCLPAPPHCSLYIGLRHSMSHSLLGAAMHFSN